jgi:hypothetical protein
MAQVQSDAKNFFYVLIFPNIPELQLVFNERAKNQITSLQTTLPTHRRQKTGPKTEINLV